MLFTKLIPKIKIPRKRDNVRDKKNMNTENIVLERSDKTL